MAEVCTSCGADRVPVFLNGAGWVDDCPECTMAASRDAVMAWPDETGDLILLGVGGAVTVLAVADARKLAGALGGALALWDGARVFETGGAA